MASNSLKKQCFFACFDRKCSKTQGKPRFFKGSVAKPKENIGLATFARVNLWSSLGRRRLCHLDTFDTFDTSDTFDTL